MFAPVWTFQCNCPEQCLPFTGGKTFFIVFLRSMCTKQTAHSWTYWRKKRPKLNTTAYIYIYMLWCYYLGQVWPFEVLLSGPSLLFTKHCLSKNTIKIGVSTLFFWKTNCARKFEVLLSGPSWSFLRCSQLGPNNNTYLAQIITPQNAFFFQFFAFKNLLKYLFYCVFWTSTKNWQKKGQQKKR